MAGWSGFEREAPELAAAGRRLMVGADGVAIAFLGENDEEFQLAGSATEVSDESERAAVHDAIPFPAFERSDPIFRFDLERSLWVFWERVGQPDTKAIRRRWRAAP